MIKIILYICLVLVVSGFLFWKFWFCRKPIRSISNEDVIISPANGRVEKILEFNKRDIEIKKGLFGKIHTWTDDVAESGYVVLIMMTPINVHVQRAPYDAKVVSQKYVKGSFLNAVKDASSMKASLENEHNEILFETDEKNKFKVIQIAGFLARRIHDYTKINKSYNKGDEIGFIDLGSQVALILPKNIDLIVKEGAVVVDGESVIGRWMN